MADLQPELEGPPEPTREMRRSRRKREVRAATVSVRRLSKRDLALGRMLYPEGEGEERPRTRDECASVPRPCPFVSCKHNLYLDVSARTGAIKLNFPDLEPDELPPEKSCALDVVDATGGVSLEEAGSIMNLTRERIRQIEVKALAKCEAAKEMFHLRDFHGEGTVGKRRLPVLEHDDEADTFEGKSDFDAAEFASDALDE